MRRLRGWLGGPGAVKNDPPMWGIILHAAAGGDPLRAQEIEEQLSLRWWKRYVAYLKAKATVKNAR